MQTNFEDFLSRIIFDPFQKKNGQIPIRKQGIASLSFIEYNGPEQSRIGHGIVQQISDKVRDYPITDHCSFGSSEAEKNSNFSQ